MTRIQYHSPNLTKINISNIKRDKKSNCTNQGFLVTNTFLD